MTKLGVFTVVAVSTWAIQRKNAPKFRNLCKISLNIYLTIAKALFLLS